MSTPALSGPTRDARPATPRSSSSTSSASPPACSTTCRTSTPSAEAGSRAPLGTVLPAVTCAAQSTFLTGTTPAEHGIVGNGWYFRDLGDVLLWRQHNGLVDGDKLWDAARRAHPGYTVANICWWYAMGADTDWTVTPRPVYYADGRKEPDCYTRPPALHDELTEKLGTFPLFHFWGPGADLVSSQWIIDATRHLLATRRPDLALAYLPHLDYDLQRYGPDDPRSHAGRRRPRRAPSPRCSTTPAREGRTVVALSEYGITRVSRPVDINRALRRAGLLEVHTQDGMEYLDPMASRAFAVADHQIAHVYVRRPEDLDATREALAGLARHRATPRRRGQEGARPRPSRAPASSSPSRNRTPGSRTTTGSTTPARPTSRSSSRSTANPATTPSSSSWTPSTPTSRSRRRGRAGPQEDSACATAWRSSPWTRHLFAAATAACPPTDDDGPLILCSTPARLPDGRVAATDVKSLLLHLAGLG